MIYFEAIETRLKKTVEFMTAAVLKPLTKFESFPSQLGTDVALRRELAFKIGEQITLQATTEGVRLKMLEAALTWAVHGDGGAREVLHFTTRGIDIF